ncbi:MAG: RluA family pseudouridine synthase [Oscillospiraceae bacterium]|nr:RluA family pseudouridine synthase [Oscillospiraceae bacterium]
MTKYTVGKNDANQRADRFVSRIEKGLTAGQIQRLFRKKDVKLDGRPIKPDTRLPEGGVLTVYGGRDDLDKRAAQDGRTQFAPTGGSENPPFVGANCVRPHCAVSKKALDITYEDENLLLLWKPPGLLSQPDSVSAGAEDSLLARVKRYLLETGAWTPETENTFSPALCHRLDRGTEGLVMAAKNAQALRILTEKLRAREIRKFYRCVVHGRPLPAQGIWEDFLFKDAKKGRVYVRPRNVPGAKSAALRYETIRSSGALSLMDVELMTGRTHQIRVQFASRGYPLLGDGKYGQSALDRPYSPKRQALCAFRLEFAFQTPAGELDYLRGKVFERDAAFSDLKLVF